MDKNIVIQDIKKTLDAISHELQLHGGGIQFVDFKDGNLYISIAGACIGCPASACGLMANLEQKVKQSVSEVKKVIIV